MKHNPSELVCKRCDGSGKTDNHSSWMTTCPVCHGVGTLLILQAGGKVYQVIASEVNDE